jgi:hypothetical protein
MSDLSNYQCLAGYYCNTGESVNNPTATECPANTFCVTGSVFAQRCADGYKNTASTGQESCTECGAGSFCYQTGDPTAGYTENVDACPADTTECTSELLKRETKCQDGYFLNTTDDSCDICPETKYCRGGHIAGNCVSGVICDVDVSSPISTPYPINRQCPINQYCIEASTAGVTCDAGTFNGNLGAISSQECFPCEPGYTCKDNGSGTITVTACPIGYWCPEYDQTAGTQDDPQECPIYTYSSQQKLFLVEMCTYCPAGYNCNTTAISEYQLHPCDSGYFCLPNALNDLTSGNDEYKSRHQCPMGYYSTNTKLTDKFSCEVCPAGYYCDPTISSTTPQVCTSAQECVQGSELEVTCPGGYYCNTTTNFQREDCPVNYFCHPGVGEATSCPAGVICPINTLAGTKCGKGFEEQVISGVDTCIACAPGYYNTDAAESCKLCPAGYLCYGEPSTASPANSVGGTNTATPLDKDVDYGEICPKGHYCPEGSYVASACPVGKYNAFVGMKSEDDCLVCPTDHYNDLTGQEGCQPCGEFAYSLTGATTCTCYGNFRTFGKSDSSCRCLPRFVYRKEDGTIERNNVSKEDCIPLTYDRCDTNTQGRSSDGTCVTVSANACSSECTNGGTFDKVTGKCTCDETPSTADEVCNSDCRRNRNSIGVASDGSVTFTDSNGTTTSISYGGDSNYIGGMTCSKSEGCGISQCGMGSSGSFEGKYGVNDYNKNKVTRRRMLMQYGSDFEQSYWEFEHRRMLAASTTTADTATISNPVLCLENGDSLQFEITDYTHYPVYDENNILNTNENFDYGPFTDLESQITAKSIAGSTDTILFSNTFTEGGTYVFTDKTITTNQLVVVVASAGETCPDSSSNIQTSTSRALSATGTSQADNIVLALDIPLLCTIIGLLIAIIILIGASVAYCLHKAFDMSTPKVEGYRTYQKNHDLDFEILGDQEAPEVVNQELCHYIPVEDEDDMENVSFNIHADIIKHSNDFLNLYNDIMYYSEERKANERRMANEMVNEIDALIKLIGDSAIHGNMYYGPARDQEQVLEDLEKDQRDAGSRPDSSGSPNGREDEDDLKAALNREVLEKEEELRALIIREDAQTKEEALKREIMNEMKDGEDGKDVDDDYEQYDENGLSLQDKIKQRIKNDDNLDSLNRDKLLMDYDKKFENIENELEKERARQEQALSQLLRAKADARRKKKQLTGNDQKDQEELDKIQKQYQEKLREKWEDIDQEIYEHEVNYNKTKDPSEKEAMEQLKQRKAEEAERLEKERLKAAKAAMDRLNKQGDMDEKEITSLIDKFIPKDSQEKLAMDQDFNEQVQQINQQKEFELEDLKRRQEEEMGDLENKLDRSNLDDDAIDMFVNTLSQRVMDQNQDASEDERQKHYNRMDELRDKLKDNDHKLEKDALMNAWEGNANDAASMLDRQKSISDARLREKLKNRKKDKKQKMIEALKIAHEEEEAKLILDQLGREHLRKSEINRDQICKIVKLLLKEMEKAKENGEEIPELTLNKIKQLFESMFAEVEMADFTNQLVKHFAEKEVMLKRLLARYADIARMEKASIRKHYAQKMKELEEQEDKLDPEAYEAIKKDIILNEEKAIRNMNLDKIHKEEEAALLQSLEKRHAKESIQLKNDLLEEKIKATHELFRSKNRKGQEEEMIYKKAFQTYKAKKEKELERRLRAIEFQKSKAMDEIEREIQNKINDYEELLRRRAQEEEEIRKALEAHKALIKARMDAIGATDKDKIFEELNKHYKGLTHSIQQERKRMFMLTQQRDQKRKDTYQDRHLNDFFNNLATGSGDKVGFMSNHSYMGKMLNQWKAKNESMKMKLRIESSLKLNYKNLQTPESLMAELLRRVKNLEMLLRHLDG